MWITNGGFADVYIKPQKLTAKVFSAFIVERTFPDSRRATKNTRWEFTAAPATPIFCGKLQGAEGKSASTNRTRAHCRIQYFEFGADLRQGCASVGPNIFWPPRRNMRANAKRFGKSIGEFGLMKEKVRLPSGFSRSNPWVSIGGYHRNSNGRGARRRRWQNAAHDEGS